MLRELKISNVAVIESASLTPGEGFTCLTGETGAGKSVLLGSVNAVIGQKISHDVIRTGESSATVTALFDSVPAAVTRLLEEKSIPSEPDGELLISRKISRDGKNACRVNGSPVTVGMLREIGIRLVNIHGQSDSQILSDPKNHLGIIERFAGNKSVYDAYVASYRDLRTVMRQIKEIKADAQERAETIKALKAQVREIDDCALYPGERDELTAKRQAVRSAAKIANALETVKELISGDDDSEGAASMLLSAATSLGEITGVLSEASSMRDAVTDAYYALEETSRQADNALSTLNLSDAEINEIEERLSAIEAVIKKYGSDEKEVLAFRDEAAQRLEELDSADERLESLQIEYDKLIESTRQKALELSENRLKYSRIFADEVMKQLEFLDMPGTKFEIKLNRRSMCITGCDELEFFISANRGEEPKPLAKTASGGEMSRIMLAIKSVMSDADDIPTLIFDEIDTGVSGHAAGRIAMKLSDLSKKRQVICITHLPSIAAFADEQYLIKKNTNEEKTYTSVTELDRQSRVKVIAQMIAGVSVDSEHEASAAKLINDAQRYKEA